MKKTETIESEFCDLCEVNHAIGKDCMGCGKALCFTCRDTRARHYPSGIHFRCSEDGLYCEACDERLRKSGDKLHEAYRAIVTLQNEYRGFHDDFDKRSKAAELRVKALRPTRGD